MIRLLPDFHILRQCVTQDHGDYKYNSDHITAEYIFHDLWEDVPDILFGGGCKANADCQ